MHRPTLFTMGEVEVKWVQVRTSRGTPLERWEARLIKPMQSLEFAWIYRHDGWWHLEIMLEDFNVRRVAKFVQREKGMYMLERWIASRWKRTIPDWGVEDPRGRKGRMTWPGRKHSMALQLSRTYDGTRQHTFYGQ